MKSTIRIISDLYMANFRVIAILIGMQLGYTESCCFFSECASRIECQHFKNEVGIDIEFS